MTPEPSAPSQPRSAALSASLEALRRRIAGAAQAHGRTGAQVTLVAVTKTYPTADAELLTALGVADLGENRVDQLEDKARTVPARWHFIGQLQSNKVHDLVAVPGLVAVHSVDRPKLVSALVRALGSDAGRPRSAPLDCFVQVDLDRSPKPGRGGTAPGDVLALADTVAAADGLRLAGLMAVAPQGADARLAFATLAELAARLRAVHPDATAISAGMSGDLEAAIEHGATHVRVGAALLGARPALR